MIFDLLSLRSFPDVQDICSYVISVTERNKVSISLLYLDTYVHSCAFAKLEDFAVSAV